MLIYKITNRSNGKVYIGKTRRKTVNRRWNEHVSKANKGVSYHLYNAIRKYGESAFGIERLYEAKTPTELSAMETFFIVLYQSHKPENGYNMTLGGDGSFGNRRTPKQVEAMRQRQLGCSPSGEARERSSQTHKQIWEARPDKDRVIAHLKSVCVAGGRATKGRKRTPEERLAISLGRRRAIAAKAGV